MTPNSPDAAADLHASRRTAITQADLLEAALRLIGPHRSVSSLGLREVAREALIDVADDPAQRLAGAARHRAEAERGIVRGSVEAFIEQVRADDKLLHVLLREGTVGSDAFKRAVDRELSFFEEELQADLIRFGELRNQPLAQPALAARAITRLAFAMGATALDLPPERDAELIDQLTTMVRMILVGARTLTK